MLTRDGTALFHETKVSGANGDRGKNIFPCLGDHEQDWQPYLVVTYHHRIFKKI